MKIAPRRTLLAVAAATAVTGLSAAPSGTPSGLDELSLPASLRGTLMVIDALPPGTARLSSGGTRPGTTLSNPQGGPGQLKDNAAFLSFTIRRWSSHEENAAIAEAFKAGGTYAVVAALEKYTVGELRFDNELRWSIRTATTWMTEKNQMVRLTTTGRVLAARAGSLPDANQLINIVDITLPRGERYGDGTLVSAIDVAFDEPGRMVPVTLAIGTGAQRLSNVEREPKH